MKKLSFYLLLQIILLLPGCKKDKEVAPKVIEVKDKFLEAIKVNGAKEARLDTSTNTIQIVLPESFKDDILDIELSLAAGTELYIPQDLTRYTKNHVRYEFKAAYPETFIVQKTDPAKPGVKYYTVYVQHEGPLTAELKSEFSLTSSVNDIAGSVIFKFKSGIGSIPEVPDGKTVFAGSLTDPARNLTSVGECYESYLNIPKITPFLESENAVLSISYNEKKFEFPGKQKINRIKPGVRTAPDYHLFRALPREQAIFTGGVFLPSKHYKINVSNDRMTTPMVLEAKFRDYGSLAVNFPDNMPDDHYLFNIYEENDLIGKMLGTVSADSAKKSFCNIWTTFYECPTFDVPYQTERVRLSKGQTFYAMPFPGILEWRYGAGVDKSKPLPDLELKSGDQVIVMKPAVRADWCYGDGTVYAYYGEYKMPANAPSGKYEARFIFAKNERSLPFWSLVEIQ
jgi:hypothetical protein